MARLRVEGIARIWESQIKPDVFRKATSSTMPVTVFLGGQPGAGKTQGGRTAQALYGGQQLVPVVGDDYRRFHPDYDYVMATEPLRMPAVTGHASGVWVGMCVAHANEQGYSILVEGTWRNRSTVLDAARDAKAYGRTTHAVVLAVPPALSQLGLLERFYRALDDGKQARWTPPQVHQTTIDSLPATVTAVCQSDLIDQVTVVNRAGDILCQDKTQASRQFMAQFTRGLTPAERDQIQTALPFLQSARQRFTPGNTEAKALMDHLGNVSAPQKSRADVLGTMRSRAQQLKDASTTRHLPKRHGPTR